MHDSLLRTDHVELSYGTARVLDGISLDFPSGRITGLIGPNGCGKSTLLNAMSGLAPIDKGRISMGGRQKKAFAPWEIRSAGSTRTFQEVRLFNQMSVLDNMLVVITTTNPWKALLGSATKQQRQQAERILERLGLAGASRAMAGSLSYGQRKLLEIGRVMATDCQAVLLDEPFAGLFPEMVARIADILRELRDEGRTIVLVEHAMDLIRSLCDQVVVMEGGRVIARGKPGEVLALPRVREAYFGGLHDT